MPKITKSDATYPRLPRCECGLLMQLKTGGTIENWFWMCECGKIWEQHEKKIFSITRKHIALAIAGLIGWAILLFGLSFICH